MKCPMCGRRTGWARTRCPACKTKLVQWYVIAAILVLVICYGAFLVLERVDEEFEKVGAAEEVQKDSYPL